MDLSLGKMVYYNLNSIGMIKGAIARTLGLMYYG